MIRTVSIICRARGGIVFNAKKYFIRPLFAPAKVVIHFQDIAGGAIRENRLCMQGLF